MSDMTEDELVETMARAMHSYGIKRAFGPDYDEAFDDLCEGTQAHWRGFSHAALNTMRAAGYVPVPVEATAAMVQVGRDTSRTENIRDHSVEGRIRRIYADMLSASPLAKKEEGE